MLNDEGSQTFCTCYVTSCSPMQRRNSDIVMRKVIEYFGLLKMEGTIVEIFRFFELNGVVREVDVFYVSSFHIVTKVQLVLFLKRNGSMLWQLLY